MELIKVRFDSDISIKTVKLHPQKVIATEILEEAYGDSDVDHHLRVMLEGGHEFTMQLSSFQNCLEIEQEIWEKVGGIQDNEELPKQRTLEEHARYRITTGAGS